MNCSCGISTVSPIFWMVGTFVLNHNWKFDDYVEM